jgi:two-component system sensor histidine kinase KdpD
LTSLVGLSESLKMASPPLPSPQQDLAEALHNETLRMSALVTNLLDMARIQNGDVHLNLQWQPLEEVVGSALRLCKPYLGTRRIETRLPRDLPLIRFDAMLIERVLCNLLENASKYTPSDSHVVIAAEISGHLMNVSVFDNGPGLPTGREESLFEKFTRGERESATTGVGLGLAICRAIIEAHGGMIRAGKSPEGGAAFIFTLPLGTPPVTPDFDAGEAITEHEH